MNEKIKKTLFFKRHIIAVVCFILLVTFALVVAFFRWEPKPDPASERIIREEAAKKLNKDPNELTDEDFANILEFNLWSLYNTRHNYQGEIIYTPPWIIIELSDIRLLKKFTNLKVLSLERIRLPKRDFPKWMKYLAKIGVLNLEETQSLDLSPLKNLTNLEVLYIQNCPNITDKQVEELQKALPNLKIVR